jgi:hypothetical protein
VFPVPHGDVPDVDITTVPRPEELYVKRGIFELLKAKFDQSEPMAAVIAVFAQAGYVPPYFQVRVVPAVYSRIAVEVPPTGIPVGFAAMTEPTIAKAARTARTAER